MKNLILSACLMLCSTFTFAQIELQLLDETIFENVHINEEFLDLSIHINVTYTGTETAEIKWDIVPTGNCPAEWGFQGCDDNTCYLEGILSNINPPGEGPNVPSIMDPGESYDFVFHLRPHTAEGCCNIDLTFAYVDDPDNILNSVSFPLGVHDSSCITSTDDNPELAQISVYPNPFTDNVYIENSSRLETLVIYNVQGSKLKEFNILEQSEINLADFSSGIYLAKVFDRDNQLTQTIKLVKE